MTCVSIFVVPRIARKITAIVVCAVFKIAATDSICNGRTSCFVMFTFSMFTTLTKPVLEKPIIARKIAAKFPVPNTVLHGVVCSIAQFKIAATDGICGGRTCFFVA